MVKSAFKIGKAKKIVIDDKGSHLVLKITGKVPTKILREIKQLMNAAVQEVLNPSGPIE